MNQEKLIELYEQVRAFLHEKFGLKPRELAYKRDSIDEANNQELTNSIKWLEAFITVRIENYNKAWELVPPERWKYYEAVCPDAGTFEQVQLQAAKKAIITDWKNRPNLLRKVKHERFDRKIKKKKVK